jgi:hypothetical protein
VHRMVAVEFLARLADHIPAKGEVCTRYYGAYASRRRAWWRRRGVVLAGAGQEAESEPEREAEPWPALKARPGRWAELLWLVFRVAAGAAGRGIQGGASPAGGDRGRGRDARRAKRRLGAGQDGVYARERRKQSLIICA